MRAPQLRRRRTRLPDERIAVEIARALPGPSPAPPASAPSALFVALPPLDQEGRTSSLVGGQAWHRGDRGLPVVVSEVRGRGRSPGVGRATGVADRRIGSFARENRPRTCLQGGTVKDGIDWTEVGAGGRFEKIVSTLLSTLRPDSERIDGAGGDGGRDHQLRSDDRLDLWQS